MTEPRDLRNIHLSSHGCVQEDPRIPEGVRVLDAAGAPITPVNAYLRELYGNGNAATTCRAYAYALLRWWRFLDAIEVPWDHAGPSEHIDFVVWLRSTAPRHGSQAHPTGRPGYAARTINLSNAVVAGFYDFHARRGTGPMLTPIRPNAPRAHAHHNPMHSFVARGRRLGQQKIPKASPKAIPEQVFNTLFAQLHCHRDRALIGIYVSSGARAAELLGLTGDGIDWGQHRIRVHRKGDGREQWLPVSGDAMVWLSLYLGARAAHPGRPVWLTRRGTPRPLSYHASRKVFERAQHTLGTSYTLHQLRHTAAYRMVQDPNLSLTDVAWVLGHASLHTTQLYTVPGQTELFERMAAHYTRPPTAPPTLPAGYDPAALEVLFGGRHA
ncbi:tyrosine-type recombinase/integrase [Agromyces mediolanus]|uniref:Integrase n=1 Tax=Agromyces mediolanus TaxID=41986 RepID=A0A918CE68_AGRME|nr:site-specific integrase [Agromyces mediolanus]GGR16650.1 integrase [Agromyces mediolanus]GLJ73659.1 integrase [Agromyces mediolanus]